MELSEFNLEWIVSDDEYRWIGIEPWLGRKSMASGSSWKESYDALHKHHKEETEYLVEIMRKMAKELLDERKRHQNTVNSALRIL
jgi:hypothetical protein